MPQFEVGRGLMGLLGNNNGNVSELIEMNATFKKATSLYSARIDYSIKEKGINYILLCITRHEH